MRTLCIEEFNQVYSLDSILKQKQNVRNRDIHVSDMDNYIEMKKQIEKNTENLKQTKKSNELERNSKDIKDKIDKLKISKLNTEQTMKLKLIRMKFLILKIKSFIWLIALTLQEIVKVDNFYYMESTNHLTLT